MTLVVWCCCWNKLVNLFLQLYSITFCFIFLSEYTINEAVQVGCWLIVHNKRLHLSVFRIIDFLHVWKYFFTCCTDNRITTFPNFNFIYFFYNSLYKSNFKMHRFIYYSARSKQVQTRLPFSFVIKEIKLNLSQTASKSEFLFPH